MSPAIFDQLNNPISKNPKATLLAYLVEQIASQAARPANSEEIAYSIAGLLSSRFVASLPDDDPYVKVLSIAAQLELPKSHRGSATWEQFKAEVDDLANKERTE